MSKENTPSKNEASADQLASNNAADEIQSLQKSTFSLHHENKQLTTKVETLRKLTSAYRNMSEEEFYKEKIATLQAEMKKLIDVEKKQNKEIISLAMKFENECQAKEKLIAKAGIEEKTAELQKEIEEEEKVLEEKQRDLEEELDRKHDEILDLKSSIAELKDKINQTGTDFSQTLGSTTASQEKDEPDSNTSKNQPQPL